MQSTIRSLDDISKELGLMPQFLSELSEQASGQYRIFDLPKKSGGSRTICVPTDRLKVIQRLILDIILSKIEFPPHVHGSVKGRSIVTNARGHVGKPLIVNIDLADFFGSIKTDLVYGIYESQIGLDANASKIMTKLTTYGNSLPQGAPTSPALANLAALELDNHIIEICDINSRSFEYHYSRYVDDITISGDTEIAKALPEIYRQIYRLGFRANPKKLKVARQNYRQKVTGVIVNKKVNAPKKLIRSIRQQLYYCSKFGFDNHCDKLDIEPGAYWRELKGLIGFIRMTRPELADEFDLKLYESKNQSVKIEPDEEEKKLMFLRAIIGSEKITTFEYNKIQRRVAPSEILVDYEGLKSLKAFQLSPEHCWKKFKLSYIESLKVEEA